MIHVIFGPTGSGKTEIAIELAHFYHAPIVNADAFQIYKDMNIGTAKISVDDPDYKNHYLLDIKLPNETYSVKEYQDDFRDVVSKLLKEYKDVIVCGGTGLYIRAALYDYEFLDEQDDNQKDYATYSNEELHKMLEALDNNEANKIHMNNRKRVIRALNLINNAGTSKSELLAKQDHQLIYQDVKFYFLNPDREALYENINKRVDKMIELGLVDEVKSLLDKYELSSTARMAIGYKEIIDYLKGQTSLEDAIELIKKRSRNYAKRQVTFFKNQFKSQIFTSKTELLKEAKKNV